MVTIEKTIQILENLVAYPTTSESSNLDLLHFIEEYCERYGAKTKRFYNAKGDKANLLISIGPDLPGGMVLSGHTDVVPVHDQKWLEDPYQLRNINNRLIGRGAVDMKGFLACCLAILPEVDAKQLKKPLHFAFSYDEEVGCLGVHSLVEWLAKSAIKPAFAIIGEPSLMRAVNAHKGGLIGWIHVHGKPGHSSQPDRYVNAVMIAAKIINYIEKLRSNLRKGPYFAELDPPYSTIQVNQIHGGTAGNIVAEKCSFFFEMRIIPGYNPQTYLADIKAYADSQLENMKQTDPACDIIYDIIAQVPALQPNISSEFEKDILHILEQDTLDAVPYGTEAGIFQTNGIPAIICGPGEIAQAHQPEEYIETHQLQLCNAFLLEAINLLK